MLESRSFSVQKVTSEEIKEGLERIKKAQEQVLDELRRNQQSEIENSRIESSQALYRNTSQVYRMKLQEN